jgi:hypothetical protein
MVIFVATKIVLYFCAPCWIPSQADEPQPCTGLMRGLVWCALPFGFLDLPGFFLAQILFPSSALSIPQPVRVSFFLLFPSVLGALLHAWALPQAASLCRYLWQATLPTLK